MNINLGNLPPLQTDKKSQLKNNNEILKKTNNVQFQNISIQTEFGNQNSMGGYNESEDRGKSSFL